MNQHDADAQSPSPDPETAAEHTPTMQVAASAGTDHPRRTIAIVGALFLMAMSAAGPGFISQTGTFTAKYGASFAAAIVASVVIDIAIQLNVWRVIGLSGLRAQDLANKVIPGSGHVLAGLITIGGVIFCIGNISATDQGLRNLLGLDPRIGAVISAALAIVIFTYKALEGTLDRAVILLGTIKIGLIACICVVTAPPVGEAALRTLNPVGLEFLPVLTLIGGTVGGYITYAGAHRLIESGTTGRGNLTTISRGRSSGSWSRAPCAFCCSWASSAPSWAERSCPRPTRSARRSPSRSDLSGSGCSAWCSGRPV